jgi:membrane-bound lytic murein transglycosylase B
MLDHGVIVHVGGGMENQSRLGLGAVSRRGVLVGLAGALAGCAMGSGGSASSPAQWAPVRNAGFDAWAQSFAARATARGLPAQIVGRAMASAGYIPLVVERDRNQTEVKRSIEDYLSIAASDTRIAQGRATFAQHAPVLSALQSRYGVPAQVITAVWGLESFYGTRMGDVPVISALATLAYDGRRGEMFEGQLIAALRILAAGDISQDRMLGSWAGAMGHTQFMPTSYLAYAVDYTGDGRRDIWGRDPSDALASTAAYLAKSGWQSGAPWGEEVRAPSGVPSGVRDASAWAAVGVSSISGGPLRGAGRAEMLRLGADGQGGPALLLYGNTRVIMRYNNALSYAIGVGHLSDRIAGGGPLRAGFGPDAAGLTKNQRVELQQLLNARGFDAGTPDGVIGKGTEAAIAAYQRASGMAVTGQPSLDLLARLR